MSKEKVDVKKVGQEIIESVAGLKEAAKEVKGLKSAWNLLPLVIKEVEIFAQNVKMAGSQKKDVAVYILNKLIDLKYIPEYGEKIFFSLGIDALVSGLNKLLGKDWLNKLLKLLKLKS